MIGTPREGNVVGRYASGRKGNYAWDYVFITFRDGGVPTLASRANGNLVSVVGTPHNGNVVSGETCLPSKALDLH